jgi:hypothetical protein
MARICTFAALAASGLFERLWEFLASTSYLPDARTLLGRQSREGGAFTGRLLPQRLEHVWSNSSGTTNPRRRAHATPLAVGFLLAVSDD